MIDLSSIKVSFKRYIRRLINYNSVNNNQSQILQVANLAHATEIYLKPVPPLRCGGTVDRYYHFIFDLVLPLYSLRAKGLSLSKSKFIKANVGMFDRLFKQLVTQDIEISDRNVNHKNSRPIELIGMNPKSVFIRKKLLRDFKIDICKNIKINLNQTPNKILLIERMPPDEYFFSQCESKGGGSSWRSIINHQELHHTLSSMVDNSFEFHNLQLENMSFEEQVYYFDRALVVIAQHGAGLTNCLWMRKGTTVIELGHSKKDIHYKILSNLLQLKYHWYKTDKNHAEIDLKDLTEWLAQKTIMKKYFHQRSI